MNRAAPNSADSCERCGRDRRLCNRGVDRSSSAARHGRKREDASVDPSIPSRNNRSKLKRRQIARSTGMRSRLSRVLAWTGRRLPDRPARTQGSSDCRNRGAPGHWPDSESPRFRSGCTRSGETVPRTWDELRPARELNRSTRTGSQRCARSLARSSASL